MKKLIYLAFLAIGMTGCSVESLDSTDNLLTADAKFKIQEAQDPMGFYAGNSDNYKGTLSVWNDCDNLYVEILPSGDAPEEAELGVFYTLPGINNGGNLLGNLEYDLNDATDLKWTIALSTLDTDAELLVFAKAWGDWAGTLGHGKQKYSVYQVDLSECDATQCAYGKGYWKNHGPDNPGNQENMYPIESLEIAGESYDQVELQKMLGYKDNEVERMTQHLIAVLLNLANGVDGSSIQSSIEAAEDVILGNITVKQEINSIKDSLEIFNDENACEDYEEYEEYEDE